MHMGYARGQEGYIGMDMYKMVGTDRIPRTNDGKPGHVCTVNKRCCHDLTNSFD